MLFYLIGSKSTGTTPRKRWNKVARKSVTENIGGYNNNGSGIEHGVYAALTVIAHHQSAKLQPCICKTAFGVVPDLHTFVIVFEVRCIGICAQVTPFTNHRVSDEAVMSFITVTENN